jgi:hypothetical protein
MDTNTTNINNGLKDIHKGIGNLNKKLNFNNYRISNYFGH